MRTGAHLKIEPWGSNAVGVRLHGDPRRPEHAEFMVAFPGGEVIVARTTDGDYWVHVYTARPGTPGHRPDDPAAGYIVDARLDISEKHSSEVDVGDFNDPGLYHLAVRIAPDVAAAHQPASRADTELQAPPSEQVCRWEEDESGVWWSDCGEVWLFEGGTLAECNVRFCYECHRVVEAIEWSGEETDEEDVV